MLILLIITLFGTIVMVIYAIYGMSTAGSAASNAKPKKTTLLTPQEKDNTYEAQKTEKLQGRLAALESELEKIRASYTNIQQELEIAKKNELQLQDELTRRQAWVAKAEEMLNKTKEENVDLQNKFVAKEKELEQEFAKNVNSDKEIRGLKEKLLSSAEDNKDKADKIESQKHRIEKLNKELKAQQETIAEFKKKEEISEWVPKQEFNRLNEEFSALEKELEEKEEKLKILAQELMQLRNQLKNKEPAPKELLQPQPQASEEPEQKPEAKAVPEVVTKEGVENQKSTEEGGKEERGE